MSRQPDLVVGRVAMGVIRAIHEGRAGGKVRPIILVKPHPTLEGEPGWAVLGMTSKPHYEDGVPRTPMADWVRLGVHQPGFYWSGRLAFVPLADIYEPIGWVGIEDAAIVKRLVRGTTGLDFAVTIAMRS